MHPLTALQMPNAGAVTSVVYAIADLESVSGLTVATNGSLTCIIKQSEQLVRNKLKARVR